MYGCVCAIASGVYSPVWTLLSAGGRCKKGVLPTLLCMCVVRARASAEKFKCLRVYPKNVHQPWPLALSTWPDVPRFPDVPISRISRSVQNVVPLDVCLHGAHDRDVVRTACVSVYGLSTSGGSRLNRWYHTVRPTGTRAQSYSSILECRREGVNHLY